MAVFREDGHPDAHCDGQVQVRQLQRRLEQLQQIMCNPLRVCQFAQAGDLQIGVSYSSANANYEYVTDRITDIGIYTDFAFREHWGFEVTFHQLDDPNSDVYQRTYEVGGRYMRHYRSLTPYARGSVGRRVL